MAKYSDASPHPERWTNKKLIAELRSKANFERFGGHGAHPPPLPATPDVIRDETRLYRDTWVNPIIAVIESRLIKAKAKP